MKFYFISVLYFLLLLSCSSSADSPPIFVQNSLESASNYQNYKTKDPWAFVPVGIRKGGYYKLGTPYRIEGKLFTPYEDYNFSEIGQASWYGQKFHLKQTANGEIFDMNLMTAAHRSLPLPSYVRVTNLENKRWVIVRVNDRGPYANDRILDISKKGGELLGFEKKGVAKVLVEVLPQTSQHLKAMYFQKNFINSIGTATQNYPWIHKSKTLDLVHGKKEQSVTAGVASSSSVVSDKMSNYYVQMASFSDLNRAILYKQNINLPLSKKLLIFKDHLMYQVCLGPFSTKEEARFEGEKLKKVGYESVFITQK